MAGCEVLVVGCNHGIQAREYNVLFDSNQVKEQRAQFEHFIRDLVKKHGIQFIAEEWGPASLTIAQVAASESGTIPWHNINTSREELLAMGIPADYVNGSYSAENKYRWTRERERVMLEKILDHKGDMERLIVVCGFDHMEPLAELLRRICKSVEAVDYRRQGWYVKDVFTE